MTNLEKKAYRIAEKIAETLRKNSIEFEHSESRSGTSASTYISIRNIDKWGQGWEIRVSDHNNRYTGGESLNLLAQFNKIAEAAAKVQKLIDENVENMEKRSEFSDPFCAFKNCYKDTYGLKDFCEKHC